MNKKPNATEEIEANYWLGNLYWWQKPSDFVKAARYLARAAELAEREKSPGWESAALREAASLNVTRLQQEADPKRASAVDLATSLRERAGKLLALAQKRSDLALLTQAVSQLREAARVLESANKPLEALRVYDQALPKNLADVTVAYLPLLTARNRLYVAASWQDAIQEQKPSADTLVRQADRALALAEDLAVTNSDKAEAFGAAGLCYQDAAKEASAAADERRTLRLTSIEHLAKSIQLAPQHSRSWIWHRSIAEQCLQLMAGTTDGDLWKTYKLKATENLDKAIAILKDAPALQKELRNLKDKVEESTAPKSENQ